MEIVDKFNDFKVLLNRAVNDFEVSLNANLSKYNNQEIDWIKNAQIQKFEFCVELTWKTAKVYLETIEDKMFTPKLVAKSLFLTELINEELYLKLMNCIEDRNRLSHVYKFEMFDLIHVQLPNHFQTIQQILQILNQLKINNSVN